MALKVRITRRAHRDIAEVKSYILAYDRAAAERVRLAIVGAIDVLSEHGLAGPLSEVAGVRVKLVPPYRYRVYYRVTAECVEILHVRHTSQRAPDPSEVI
jgi:toxin ParE1/3/4